MMTKDTAPCEHCGAEATIATALLPIGSEPGQRVYECPACKRLSWIAWHLQRQVTPQLEPPIQRQQRHKQQEGT